MINLFSAKRVRELDAQEVTNEGITSFELMQRASNALYKRLDKRFNRFIVFATGGNNGGDALCIANKLHNDGHDVLAYYIKGSKQSDDFATAFNHNQAKVREVSLWNDKESEHLKSLVLQNDCCIIDGLLGSGTNREIQQNSLLAEVVSAINSVRDYATIVSIDLPSGLFGEETRTNDFIAVKAHKTFCLQYPKLSTLLPEYEQFVGRMECVDFGMKIMKTTAGDVGEMIEISDVRKLLSPRPIHGHKGTFGKALLIAGSEEMPGACMLSAKATLRGGCGLLYIFTHEAVKQHLISFLPEAICNSSDLVSLINSTDATAIGPGLSKNARAKQLVETLLDSTQKPIVVDADALNIIAENPTLLDRIPKGSILTPHPAEFQRLFGKCSSRLEMIMRQKEVAKKQNVVIILKGAYSTISDGERIIFNSSGNSGMATAGSGDVLTGIILSLLSQGYSPLNSAIIGTFVHGFAGDFAKRRHSEYSLIASDIIENIGRAYKKIVRFF